MHIFKLFSSILFFLIGLNRLHVLLLYRKVIFLKKEQQKQVFIQILSLHNLQIVYECNKCVCVRMSITANPPGQRVETFSILKTSSVFCGNCLKIWIHGFPHPSQCPGFSQLIDILQGGKKEKKLKLMKADFLLIYFCQSVKMWGPAAVNASHSGLCLVSITPAFCPRRKYKKQRQNKKRSFGKWP